MKEISVDLWTAGPVLSFGRRPVRFTHLTRRMARDARYDFRTMERKISS